MAFLIRMGFWFSLVLLALPFGVGGSDSSVREVGPIEALFAAKDAVSDVAGLCQRKPDVCETGRAAFQTISVRAQESARLASTMIDPELPADPAAADLALADVAAEPTTTGSIPLPTARPDHAPF
ncbi:DUF5330 domain-containing protein [Tianweitania sediminis]|uniref:DUF5330 domain-containing protein n=1 Tax=Tianweitania sediminis TaxID=1502156 RepID=A0A8J7R6M2_9HYPH|nr:DUF5330 domain-containing protein [Tianweitania sediminis]MBP0438882.1 DUF5330 domain-containing protein [Tianweitania sediminis]HEV7417317.1 DUF5330 domain-containing protein [Tianweitania sediminis]